MVIQDPKRGKENHFWNKMATMKQSYYEITFSSHMHAYGNETFVFSS